MPAVKKSRKSKRKTGATDNPRWNRDVLVSREDIINAIDCVKYFGTKLPAAISSVYVKMKAGKSVSIDDQRVVARFCLGIIASKVEKISKDSLFADMAAPCAHSLMEANLFDMDKR